jgi:phosphate transport system protein
MAALSSFSPELAAQVFEREALVNHMEMEIDRELSGVIARRQPAARDLRLLVAVSKAIANLERVGDEAAHIARTVDKLITAGMSTRLHQPVADLAYAAELATASLARRWTPSRDWTQPSRWRCSNRATRSTRSSMACCASSLPT